MIRTMGGHQRILSLEVTGGFLQGVKLEFSDGLNCIIDGRGTGKTTVLEFIRYVLGLVPDQKRGRHPFSEFDPDSPMPPRSLSGSTGNCPYAARF